MDDLFELVFEFIGSIVEEFVLDKRIPRGIRCTLIVVCSILLIGMILVVGYLSESAAAMWIAGILSGIVVLTTPVLVVINWRKG